MNDIDLCGCCAVITGGTQGIGRAIPESFLASCAELSLWDGDESRVKATSTESSAASKVRYCSVDVSDSKVVECAAAQTVSALWRTDILVANSGITKPNVKLFGVSHRSETASSGHQFTRYVDCCKTIVLLMIQQNCGRIVNLASIIGKEGNPKESAYSVSKAGVIALTKSLVIELTQHHIAVNCVTPAAPRARLFEQRTQEHIDYVLSKIPRGRFVKVEEIASMLAWLVSARIRIRPGPSST
jgi:NAD(P)-dependent dehydrogenase (short-subunit alcohol dehydrogenase family)